MSKLSIIFAVSCVWGAGCTARPAGPTQTEATQSGTTLLLDESFGENRLQVFGFGDSAQILKLRTIYGNGLSVSLTNRRHEVVYEGGWDADTDGGIIDYTEAVGGIFRFTDCTTDHRSKLDHVGFVETTVRIRQDGTPDIKQRVLLKGERADHESVEKLVEQGRRAIEAADEDTEAQFTDVLEHLRNMGIDNPDMVLAAMKSFYGKADGALAEALNGYMGEVELAKDIHEGH